MRFSKDIEISLRNAGWFPGRRVELDYGKNRGYPSDHPVWEILAEFAYLQIKSELDYEEDITGHLDIYDREIFGELIKDVAMLEEELKTVIGNVGLVSGIEEILVCSDGSVILQEENLCYWATNFDDFLERILVGKKRAAPPPNYFPGKWPCV